jgi:hypothetical protein
MPDPITLNSHLEAMVAVSWGVTAAMGWEGMAEVGLGAM